MKFTPAGLDGVVVVDIEPVADERGFFARTYCAAEFERAGLAPGFAQSSVSFNARRGTLRGMHYQSAPHEEVKLVRCSRGALFDVVVDLRPDSSTFCRWFGVELSADNGRALYVPRGFAHGFVTLEDGTEASYQISVPYRPESARGVRWNDPRFGIVWPIPPIVVADRDRGFPDFVP